MNDFLDDMRDWMRKNPITRKDIEDLGFEIVPSFPVLRGVDHPRYGVAHTDETKEIIRSKRASQIISHSEETKKKISHSNRGKIKTEEHRSKLAEAQRKQKGTYTQSRLEKMSKVASLGNNHKAKKVVAEWKNGTRKEYDCIKSFVLDTGINYKSAKLLAKHGNFSKTQKVRLICL